MQNSNNREYIGGVKPTSNLGIAKPTEALKSSLAMQAKKQQSVIDINAGEAYANITNRFQEILNWKATVEVSMKHKNAKIEELLKALDSNRDVVHKLQMENEKLSHQYAEELDMRKEIFQKFATTRDLSITLKDHVQNIQRQLNNAFESRDMIDKRDEKNMNKYKELISQFDSLKLAHIQEVATLKNAIEIHQQQISEVEQSYKAKYVKYDKQMEALSNALQQKEQEFFNCHKAMVEAEAHFETIEKNRELLESEVVKLKTNNASHLKCIDELENCVSKLEAEKNKLEADYQGTCNAYNELQDERAELMDKLKKCETHYSENIEKLHGIMTEVQNELSLERQRVAEANNECQQYKEQIAQMKATKADLEAKIVKCNDEIQEQNGFMEEKELDIQKKIAEMSEQENNFKLKLEAMCSEIELKTKENQQLYSMYNELKQENLTLKEESEEIKMKLNEKQSQNKIHLENASNLADQLMTTEKMYSLIQKQKDDLEKVVKNKEDELHKEQEEIQKLRSSFEEILSFKEDEISKLQVQVSELQNHTSSLGSNCAAVSNKVKSLEDEINQKNDKLSAQNEEILKLMKSLEESSAAITELEKKLSSVQEELQLKKTALDERKEGCETHDQWIKEMEVDLKNKDEEIAKLQGSIFKTKMELRDYKAKSGAPQQEIQRLSEKVSLLENQIIEKDEMLEKLRNQLMKEKEAAGSSGYIQEIEQLKCEKNIYLRKWTELQKDHTSVMMEKGNEIMALKKQINMLQQQPHNVVNQPIGTVSFASEQDKKLTSQAKVNQGTTGEDVNHLSSNTVKPSIFPKAFANMIRPRAPSNFVTLGNKKSPFFKPARKDASFDTSGSDYMDMDMDPDGVMKLVPSKRAQEKAAAENKILPSVILLSPTLDGKDRKTTIEKKEIKGKNQTTPLITPAEKSLPSDVVTSTPTKVSQMLPVSSPKIQCNVNQKKKKEIKRKGQTTPLIMPSEKTLSSEVVTSIPTKVDQMSPVLSPKIKRSVKQKKKVQFGPKTKMISDNDKENAVNSDFKESAPAAKRKFFAPRNSKGKVVRSSSVSSGLSTDPFEPFFFE